MSNHRSNFLPTLAALPLTAAALCAALLSPSSASAADEAVIRRDVVYGHKDGMALTLDAFLPPKPNGAGVLFIQSGGWHSQWREPATLLPACQPLLEKGIAVFVVWHGSAPKYNIPEIVTDVRRAVRFLRLHAADFSVEPDRLGAWGGSAGGHLALVLATTGDDGDPQNEDEVLTQPSRIAAAVAFYPPTDLRKWVTDPPESIRKLPALKPPLTFDPELAADVSPLAKAASDTAPTLLIHGDQDDVVPIDHSRQLLAALKQHHVACELREIEGAGHVFKAKDYDIAVPLMVDWFQKHLAPHSQPVQAATPSPPADNK